MLNTFQIFEELKETFEPYQAERLVKIIAKLYEDLANTVTKKEFKELTEIVKSLSEKVENLAKSQEKTEENINRVWKAIDELAQAQKRTEQRLNELAEAQKKTEQRLSELAEAQKKTEDELRKLVGEHRETRQQLGNLSHTVGYVLEDRAYKGLPQLLKRDFGIEVTEGLRRDYIEIGKNKYEEVNILGRARKNDKEVWIIGECKSQLKKTDVDEFLNSVKKIESFLKGEKILIAVTYQTSPPVRKYVAEKGIKLYFSYEMPL